MITTVRNYSSTPLRNEQEKSEFDKMMDRVFTSEKDNSLDDLTGTGEAASGAVDSAPEIIPFDPSWWPSDQAIKAIIALGDKCDLDMGLSIIATTCIVRVFLLPVFIWSQRKTSRIAHLQPEMMILRKKIEALGDSANSEAKVRIGHQMRGLFQKYETSPFAALVLPIVQLPVFM